MRLARRAFALVIAGSWLAAGMGQGGHGVSCLAAATASVFRSEPAAVHHHGAGTGQPADDAPAPCTCPGPCCGPAAPAELPAAMVALFVPTEVAASVTAARAAPVPRRREHLLPFAQAPPALLS